MSASYLALVSESSIVIVGGEVFVRCIHLQLRRYYRSVVFGCCCGMGDLLFLLVSYVPIFLWQALNFLGVSAGTMPVEGLQCVLPGYQWIILLPVVFGLLPRFSCLWRAGIMFPVRACLVGLW
jgi:hypothetical protein